MKQLIFSILFLSISVALNAQKEVKKIEILTLPNVEYAVYQYDSVLLTDILTYQYANIWDIDNDGIKDSLSFMGNGGAHTYFYFQIKLSSCHKWFVFPTFQIDRPYWTKNEAIEEMTAFQVYDIDQDGIPEIYLNIENKFGSIPDVLKSNKLTSKQLIIEFEENDLVIRNYVE